MDYKGPIEAALSSDLRGEPYNFSLWDIHTGTQLVVFKGNKSNIIPKCLQLIDNNYFITANDNLLHVWSIFNRKCQDQKLFLPGRPSTLCMSPCSNYLIVAISEMIYVWQIRSGNLLSHTQRHYQTVSVLKINQEGTFLFSGGEDGMVLVWPFADLISNTHNTRALNFDPLKQQQGTNEPMFAWQHHSAQVTDLHITNGGRCMTVSADMTANIYSYNDGKRLFCVSMPSPLWSVVMNKNETRIFLGAQDGNIYEVAVSSMSLSQLISHNRDENELARKPLFVGHKGKVTNLLISTDGSRLISASMDSSCKIWDIHQKKLLQDIKHQAPLANLVSLLVPDALALSSMTQSQAKPPMSLKPLKRSVYRPPRDVTIMSEDLFEEASTTIVYVKNKIDHWSPIAPSGPLAPNGPVQNGAIQNGTSLKSGAAQEVVPVAAEKTDGAVVQNLKAKIKDLYMLSVEKLFRDAAQDSLKPYEPEPEPEQALETEPEPEPEPRVETKKMKKKVSISPVVQVFENKRRRKR